MGICVCAFEVRVRFMQILHICKDADCFEDSKAIVILRLGCGRRAILCKGRWSIVLLFAHKVRFLVYKVPVFVYKVPIFVFIDTIMTICALYAGEAGFCHP
jgi:hypothetical protein